MNNGVFALAASGNDVYAGGTFTQAGGKPISYLARWDGNEWSAPGSGVNGRVFALAVGNGGELYAGGPFTEAGGIVVNRIARWDGGGWSALGGGSDGWVDAIAVGDNGDVYIGGGFAEVGGVAANNVTRWDGSAWLALGTGIDDPNAFVYDLAVSGGDLYVGGSFNQAGGISANHIARWDGSGWSALGEGLPGEAIAVAVNGSAVYARSDEFQFPARWDGTKWSSGGKLGGWINALEVSKAGEVYMAGDFTNVGGNQGSPIGKIVKWNGGTMWSQLGDGAGRGGTVDVVYAVAIIGTDVYVGGSFPNVGELAVGNIARWNSTGNCGHSPCQGSEHHGPPRGGSYPHRER